MMAAYQKPTDEYGKPIASSGGSGWGGSTTSYQPTPENPYSRYGVGYSNIGGLNYNPYYSAHY